MRARLSSKPHKVPSRPLRGTFSRVFLAFLRPRKARETPARGELVPHEIQRSQGFQGEGGFVKGGGGISIIGVVRAPVAIISFTFFFFCGSSFRVVADVWEKDVWEFQAKSGSSGSCGLFLHFLGKIAVQEMSGKTPGSSRHPSSRHPRPSDPS